MEKKLLPILITITVLLLLGGFIYNKKYLSGPDIEKELETTLQETNPDDFEFEE